MKIKKGGCCIETTLSEYNRFWKFHKYEVIEEDTEKYDLENMSYKELQALYSLKLGKKAVGVPKADILEELSEVI